MHRLGVAMVSCCALIVAATMMFAAGPAFAADGVITTVAGGGVGDGGPATNAELDQPQSVIADAAGDLYIADTLNCRIRKTSGGLITTVAGNGTCGYSGDGGPATSARLSNPSAAVSDGAGNLYIADTLNCRVREVSAGSITTVAGNGVCDYSGDGGAATAAKLWNPSGLAVDGAGTLFIADTVNCRVRKVIGGTIMTIAGNGSCDYTGDGGPATSLALSSPSGITLDGVGDLFVADTANCRIREVIGTMMTTVAGDGACAFSGDGGAAASATLSSPSGIALNSAGDLFIADTSNCRIRRVSGGTIATVAGDGTCRYYVDGIGAVSSSINQPQGVGTDASGNFYIADTLNCRIRKVSSGVISTVAGGSCTLSGDGGPATSASLNRPQGAVVDSVGNLYIADTPNCRVRKVANATITSVYYNGLCQPQNVAVDASGSIYISGSYLNAISCIVDKMSGNTHSVAAGYGGCGYNGDGFPSGNALLRPAGIALDAAGNLYIADTVNCRVRKVIGGTSSGTITTVAGDGTCRYGGDGGVATSAGLSNPSGVALDNAGNLYIADTANYRVREVSGGIITTVAGNGTCAYSGDGGPPTSASLCNVSGVAVDRRGNMFIADTANCRVREVSGGIITTVAGNGSCAYGGDGGRAIDASISLPSAVALDGAGDLYIADTQNNRIRKVTFPPPTVILGGADVAPAVSGQPRSSRNNFVGELVATAVLVGAALTWLVRRPTAKR